MLPGSPAVSLVQAHLRNQQGVIEVAKPAPDQLLLTVGERVKAIVTDQMPNGRFAVLIKDQLLDLNLPRNTQPGEQLELIVVSKDPKLTFALSRQPDAQNGQASQTGNTGVALSSAAKMLGEMLATQGGQAKAANVQQAQPLFAGQPQPAQLAGVLASRLAESGLFYESHQAEWVNGLRTLQTLLREPQAAMSQDGKPIEQSAVQPTAAKVPDQQMRGVEARVLTDVRQSAEVMPDQAVKQLVQQQLALLENNPLVWQGQAWAGQPLRWQLELENERDAQGGEQQAAQIWQTRLDLDLPNLGKVGVVASLRDGRFNLRFEAEAMQTLDTLQRSQSALANQFTAAGLVLESSQVQRYAEKDQS